MKKFLILIMALFFVLPAFADTMPYYTNAIPKSALGVFKPAKSLLFMLNLNLIQKF